MGDESRLHGTNVRSAERAGRARGRPHHYRRMRREGKGNRLWKSGVERGREMLGLDSSQVGIIWRILGSKDHDVENIFSFSLDFISKVEIASGRRENGLFEGIAIVPRGTILSWLWSWIAGEWREADECSTWNNFRRGWRSKRW